MKTITISGIIGWDTEAQDFREALQRANGDDVEIIINSPGGLVSDALEIYNLIRNYSGQTLVKLSGYAMSAASYIPLAANRVVAEDNAIYMIHNVIGGVYGNHNEIIKYGETVRSMSKMLGKAYASRSGKSPEEIEQLMDAETYFFGDEMVEAGFVDEIIATDTDPDKETAMTGALVAFKALEAKLGKDAEAVKDDITRAAAVADSVFKNRAPAHSATPATEGAKIMNMEKLKSEHPDLVAAVVAEAREGMVNQEDLQTQITTATAAGAEQERQRINDVRAQIIPGHEDLVEQMAFDGKSTGADAALAIVAAEKNKALTAAADIDADANPAVPPSTGSDDDQQKMARAEFNKLKPHEQSAFVRGGGKIVD